MPIHAFPVINSKVPELFPKMVDMGTGCIVGNQYTKQLQIESNCPVSFEYTIDIVQPHPEIHISPLQGDITGLQTTPIDFHYTPKTFTTAESLIKIRTSEFDSEDKFIRIIGNAQPANQTVVLPQGGQTS